MPNPTEYSRDRDRPCRDLISMNTRNVPKSVHAAFKAYCAGRGYTMENTIIALMKKAAAEDLTLPGARK